MSPICLLGLFYQTGIVWGLCPQGLAVMFFRQSLGAYDSLRAASYPDLAVAALYGPIVGWILSRAERWGKLRTAAVRAIIWHIAAIGIALAFAEIRNRAWGVG